MIDWARVKELREDVGSDNFAEVAALFLDEVTERLDLLGTAGLADLESDLHFLKGSALSLGFRAFAEACESGERAAAAGRGASVDLAALVTLFENSRVQFETQRAARLAA